jgi:glycerol-3-phosphate acyltransferase PlsY
MPRPLFQVWRDRALTVRVAYSLCAPRRGRELEDLQSMTDAMPMGFGDEYLRFNGIGENVVWGMYNNDKPTEEDRERLYHVLKWAAPRGLAATFHWHNERSVHHLLDVLERVNAETPVAPLRWSIAHLNDASPQSLKRMKALGAIVGHNWSILVAAITGRMRGGKGAATAFGTLLMIVPPQVIAGMLLVGGIVLALTRYVSLTVLIMFPLATAWMFVLAAQGKTPELFAAYCLAMAVLIFVRFRSNIERLRAGTERRLGESR